MTFADLKQRILDTGYLPLWLKNGIVATPPITMKPIIEEADPDQLWCPFGRSILTVVAEDGSQKSTKSTPHNRVTYLKADEANVIQLHAMSLRSSLCVRHRCAVWDATNLVCGMRNPLLHVSDAVQEGKALVAEMDARYAPNEAPVEPTP